MKKFTALLLAVMMLVCMAACGQKEPAANEGGNDKPVEKQFYSVGTASAGGLMYAIGSGWANLMNEELGDKYSFTAEETAGNAANIAMIESGEMEFCANGVMSLNEGFEGVASWTNGQTYNSIRVMFPMNQMVYTAYTLAGSGITCMDDLEGKTVGLGSLGGAVDSMMRDFFQRRGINVEVHNDGWAATVNALADGLIDAGITMQLAPAAALAELEATKEMFFIPFTDEELALLCEMNPSFSYATIAAGSYKAVTEDIKTVGDTAVMCCHKDIPEDVVYELVKKTYEKVDDMRLLHNAMKNWSIDGASSCIAIMHPGAVKYFNEQGIKLADFTVAPKA